MGDSEMQSEEASYIVIERGFFLKKRLNPAVENRIAPELGTVERQRCRAQPQHGERCWGVGMPKAGGGPRLLSQRGGDPTADWGGHGHPPG